MLHRLLLAAASLSFGCGDATVADDARAADSAGSTCTIEVVDNAAGGTSVPSAALALDATGVPQIAYRNFANDSITFARRIAGVWNTDPVTTAGAGGGVVSLQLGSDGKAHVSYSSSTTVMYGSNTTGAWVTETIGPGAASSLAIAPTGTVHVAHRGAASSGPQPLEFATRSGASSWSSVDVDTAGDCDQPSLALDSAGKGHVAYLERTAPSSLKYATNASGSWQRQTLDMGGVGSGNSLAIDSTGKVHVTYVAGSARTLKYATNASGSWVVTTVDVAGTVGLGDTSLAIDTNDKLHVTFYDGPNKDLGYVTNMSGTWVARSLVSGGEDLGNNSSLAIHSATSTLHASFSNRSSGVISYLTCK